MSTMVSESYSRAYARIVHVQVFLFKCFKAPTIFFFRLTCVGTRKKIQELAELQELVEYKRLERDGRMTEAKHALNRLRSLWRQRLQGVQQNVDVLLPILVCFIGAHLVLLFSSRSKLTLSFFQNCLH